MDGKIPNHVKEELETIIVRDDRKGKDGICWGLNVNEKFLVKSAYSMTFSSNHSVHTVDGERLWKLRIPQRIIFFLWLLYHGKIMTNKERKRRGFTPNPCCHFCPYMEENLDYLFRKSPQVQPLWKYLAKKVNEINFQQLPFKEWLD